MKAPMLEMQDAAQQAASAGNISSFASKFSIFSGAGTAVFGTMTHEFVFAAIGAIGTIGSLLVNSYYKRKAHELAQRRIELAHELALRAEERRMMLAQAQMEVMRDRGEVVQTGFDSAPLSLMDLKKDGGSDGN